MKKLIVIIVILAIIFVGMIGYKNVVIKTRNIGIQEIEKIENCIEQIYMWKEVTKEALPCFEDINQADETWIWEVVKKNLEEYEISYEKIQEKAKEIFGENFTKQFPKEGMEYFSYNEENDLYYAIGMDLDQLDDAFLMNKITRTEDGYEVEIIEYLEDYSESTTENRITLRNIEGEKIEEINLQDEGKINEIVKNNIEKLDKKKIYIKNEGKKLIVQRVEKE